ncbi:MAG TPA: thiamine pyrophosphate-requiring protein [Steroidobacteraceae bacterium]|nr:thiamine pyrophosphate-requiring protein [Steroidobacteraceae bacterium]
MLCIGAGRGIYAAPGSSCRRPEPTGYSMNVGQVTAQVMKLEGVEYLLTYPLNPLTERCAEVDIRPIVVRQERIGVHMADAISRLSSGDKVGVFACQEGPGIENAFGAVAQCWSEGVPLVVFPSGGGSFVKPAFNSTLNFQHVTKHSEIVTRPEQIVPALRRAFSIARQGRPGPVLIEVAGIWGAEVPGELNYTPTRRYRTAPDPKDVDAAAAALIAAKKPLIYVGQGVHYAKAWDELKAVCELVEAPVCSSLEGKSGFPETHPLALVSGGPTMSRAVAASVAEADVVFGAGASFTQTGFGIQFPRENKTFIHNTVDAHDIDKNIPAKYAMVGDSKLALGMLRDALKDRLKKPRGLTPAVAARIKELNDPWFAEWMPRLTSDSKPLSPYRVIWDLMHIADVPNTIITHDAGSPRDELSPFWKSVTPLSYIGWGKSTQLGYGLGLAMGAKLAHPEKLCMNMWGDAAIGMTGMDIETCARAKIPIMSILFNNFGMHMEDEAMDYSRKKYGSTDITGNYSEFAKALGCYSERVTEPTQIAHALVNGINATKEGKAVLLEFITTPDKVYSRPQRGGYRGGSTS